MTNENIQFDSILCCIYQTVLFVLNTVSIWLTRCYYCLARENIQNIFSFNRYYNYVLPTHWSSWISLDGGNYNLFWGW